MKESLIIYELITYVLHIFIIHYALHPLQISSNTVNSNPKSKISSLKYRLIAPPPPFSPGAPIHMLKQTHARTRVLPCVRPCLCPCRSPACVSAVHCKACWLTALPLTFAHSRISRFTCNTVWQVKSKGMKSDQGHRVLRICAKFVTGSEMLQKSSAVNFSSAQ